MSENLSGSPHFFLNVTLICPCRVWYRKLLGQLPVFGGILVCACHGVFGSSRSCDRLALKQGLPFDRSVDRLKARWAIDFLIS